MVEDQYRGQAGRCVTCNGPIEIPDWSPSSGQEIVFRSRRLIWVVASLVAIVFATVVVVVTVRYGGAALAQLQASGERVGSMRNLETITLALNAYAADHGRYPPAFTSDAGGKALHSWRVLLLPYLGQEQLYNEFRLDLPWDSSENRFAAQGNCPDVYRHPNATMMGLSDVSSYYVITGANTLFPGASSLSPSDVLDNAAQTMLVVEATPSVPSGLWTQPIDLDFALLKGDLSSGGGYEPGGWSDGGAAIACVDGRAHFLNDSTPPLVVRSLVTPRGNEQLPDDTLD